MIFKFSLSLRCGNDEFMDTLIRKSVGRDQQDKQNNDQGIHHIFSSDELKKNCKFSY